MQLDFQVSKTELLCLVVVHILVSHTVWQSDWPLLLSLTMTFALAGHGVYQLFRSLLLLDNSVIRLRLAAHGHAWLTTRDREVAAVLRSVAYRSTLLTLLDFEVSRDGRQCWRQWRPGSNRVRVLVTVGSVPLIQRKQLAYFLTYGN